MKKSLIFNLFIICCLFICVQAESPRQKLEGLKNQTISFNGEMKIYRNGREYIKRYNYYNDGFGKAMINLIFPETEAGAKIFYNDENIWLSEGKVVMKFNNSEAEKAVFGSDLTFSELKALSIENEYNYNEVVVEKNANYHIVDLIKKGARGYFSKIRIFYNVKKEAIDKFEFFDKQGKNYKTVFFMEYTNVKGYNLPTLRKVVNNLIPGNYTEVYLRDIKIGGVLQLKEGNLDKVFDLLKSGL
ncbi:MAG: outer membrane lipoprotein-sorting protein [Candidatus Muirbacterium halophilum]|nr:outer membrane lipoprotein-sorting protein [Candidatus Muirbacterium halophilum]MCK9476658.1 outer membrane lipoprotein-sorting protein [Candidatus Muirbacterium halophilum]